MKKLNMIEISNTDIHSKSFLEAVINNVELEEIDMVNCTQFKEQKMLEMFCCLPNLHVIDVTGTHGILYVTAYVICCNLKKFENTTQVSI